MKDVKSRSSSIDLEAGQMEGPPPYSEYVDLQTVSGSSGAAGAGKNSQSQDHPVPYEPTLSMSSSATIVDSEIPTGTRADAPGHVDPERQQRRTQECKADCLTQLVTLVGFLAIAGGACAGFAAAGREPNADGDTASANATDTLVEDITPANVTTMALAPASTDVTGPMTTVIQVQSTDGTSAYTTSTADPTSVSQSAVQRRTPH